VGIENTTGWNFKDLQGMLGTAIALQRNNKESNGILIGPLKAPRFFSACEIPSWLNFSHCPIYKVGFGPKFHGADGKPTDSLLA